VGKVFSFTVLVGHYDGLAKLGFGAQDLTFLGLGLVKEDGFIPSVMKNGALGSWKSWPKGLSINLCSTSWLRLKSGVECLEMRGLYRQSLRVWG
jgi:hypothetical protein